LLKRFYLLTRSLHLYFGLFISPLLLVFSISVFLLVHGWVPAAPSKAPRTVTGINLPDGLGQLKGRPQIDALRPVLDRLGVQGEVNFVRSIAKENRLVIPVIVPGREVSVDLNLAGHSAVITETATGPLAAMILLHKMPGQHNAALRGNSAWLQAWKWLADGTVWVVLFLTVSGIYMWAVLRAERRTGVALLGAGALSFFGLVYAIVR
jgi:hypothetical protein